MGFEVVFRPSAIRDLNGLEAYIANESVARAIAFIDRLQARCRDLSTYPERGVRRDDLMPGTRMLVFERRTIILYRIEATDVLILRIVSAGRNLRATEQEYAEDFDGRLMGTGAE